jgi:two-component system, LytTR family, response regulator
VAERTIRVLLVEDEPPARRRMRALLASHDDVEVVGEAAHGGEAVEEIQRLAPDLVLLDVQLPVATGFEVIDAVGVDRMPLVVFVTAYDQHAIRAFEVHAVDYLLKPVEPERLRDSLVRVRALLAGGDARVHERLRRAMAEWRAEGSPDPRRAPARLAIKVDGRIRFFDVAEIDYVTADGNYARLRGRATNVLVRETITTMEQRLAPHGFLRVQRGTLVRMERVVELEPLFHGEYVVRLKDGTRLTSGRTYRRRIRAAFGVEE